MKIKASLLVTTLLASASCFAADTYQISTSVYSQGKLVASPTMVVEADKMASIRMDNGTEYQKTCFICRMYKKKQVNVMWCCAVCKMPLCKIDRG